MGVVPAIAYNSDLGLLYGIVTNLYHYGDGSNYPNYNHMLYLEWSRTTKGSGKNVIQYDGLNLIPKARVMGELSYYTEQALDFHGFNGYETNYYLPFIDNTSDEYLSRMFFKQDRKLLKVKADVQGYLYGKKLRWLAGFGHFNIKLKTVDIERLNEGKDSTDMLPDVPLLYDHYVDWGIIPEDQKNGGSSNFFKAGIVFDTRDVEANPNKGVWSDLVLYTAPGFINDYRFSKLVVTHRQYFTIFPRKLNLAYRISFQPKIGGEMPVYMLPFVFDTKETRDGLGEAKNLRGVIRNRVVGEGFLMGNVELRWTVFRTVIWNQNFYVGLSGFFDAGKITQPYEVNTEGVTAWNGLNPQEVIDTYIKYDDEHFHYTLGAGLKLALNNNFILAGDVGKSLSDQDGDGLGVYIGLGYLF